METNLYEVRLVCVERNKVSGDSLVVDGTEECKARSNLLLWPVGLDDGADDGDVNILRANIVRRRDHGDVDIYQKKKKASARPPCYYYRLIQRLHTVPPVDLVLRDDDLHAVRVVGARDRVLEKADRANDLSSLEHAGFATLLRGTGAEVAGVSDDLLGLDRLATTTNADKLAIGISDDLIDRLVKHVCSTIDGRKASKGLRKFAETIEGVNVWRFSVTCHGRSIEDDAVISFARRFRDVADVSVSA